MPIDKLRRNISTAIWVSPAISSIILPAHAQTSLPCSTEIQLGLSNAVIDPVMLDFDETFDDPFFGTASIDYSVTNLLDETPAEDLDVLATLFLPYTELGLERPGILSQGRSNATSDTISFDFQLSVDGQFRNGFDRCGRINRAVFTVEVQMGCSTVIEELVLPIDYLLCPSA